MTLGSTIVLDTDQTDFANSDNNLMFPASLTSDWVTAISEPVAGQGGMGVADDNPINYPGDQADDNGTRFILDREERHGTTLKLRVVYDPAATAITSYPRAKVFARFASAPLPQAWQLLRTRSGAISRTFEFDLINDVKALNSGSQLRRYTTPDDLEDSFDCMGCDEFLILLEIPLAHDGGDVALASLQAKII